MFSPCSLCSARCCKNYFITITAADVLRLSEYTGKKPSEFAELVPLRLLTFDNELVLECWENGIMHEYVLTLKSHPCIFLEGNRCSVYSHAPLVCKLYPYHANGKIIPRAQCPLLANILHRLRGPEIALEHYVRELSEYKKIVAAWNERRGSLAECMDFLLSASKLRV